MTGKGGTPVFPCLGGSPPEVKPAQDCSVRLQPFVCQHKLNEITAKSTCTGSCHKAAVFRSCQKSIPFKMLNHLIQIIYSAFRSHLFPWTIHCFCDFECLEDRDSPFVETNGSDDAEQR